MATIKDVAQRANVSPTTVSYVINGNRYVRPATEERIRAAIKELDFQPDSVARSLRAKRTLTVGMIVSDITNPYYADIVRGAQDVLNNRHYSLILTNTDEAPDRELETLALLRQKKVDGLIAVNTGANAEAFYQAANAGLPIILVDRRLPDDRLCTVLVDDDFGAYQATQHLLRLGHRRIGIIMGKAGISTTDQRREGYEAALREAGIAVDPAFMVYGHSTLEGGIAASRTLLSLTPPPTAIFATNNLMTVGLFLTINELRLRCPQDIAVVGFDDIVWLSAFHPTLTTVAQPSNEIGKQAAELLLKRIEEKNVGKPCIMILPTKLVIRESSGQSITPVRI
jgi:LacI family transcriptional regulator